MKNISKFILLAAASFAASCSVSEPYAPGEADADGCYGVYFPVQETAGEHTYSPEDPTVAEFAVARHNTDGSITVPVTMISDDAGIFEVGTLSFADGEAETTLTVNFPDAEEGTLYSMSLCIEDPQYASKYLAGDIAIDFSVIRVKWLDLLNPQGEKAVVTFKEEWWDEVHDARIKYYEVNGVRTCIAYTDDPEEGIWGTATELNFTWDTATDKLNCGVNFMGWDYDDQGPAKSEAECSSPVYVYDWYSYWLMRGQISGTAEEFYAKYEETYPQSYYDPAEGIFYFNFQFYIPAAGGGWTGLEWDTEAWIDGFTHVDYSIKISAGLTEDGAVPVSFKLGSDVAAVKYAVYEGPLTATQAAGKAGAIADGTEAAENADIENPVVGIKCAATGVYTVLAVVFDEKGAAQGYETAVFTYVADGDLEDNAVVFECGLGSAAKYKGADTDTDLEVYAYGDNIADAKFKVISKRELSKDMEKCIEAVKNSDSADADIIDAINGSGYTGLVEGLDPGTEYCLVAWVSNGYLGETFISDGFSTTGEPPLPIYKNYLWDNLAEEYIIEDPEEFIGEWNVYAVDMFGDSGVREYIGKASITDSYIPDEGPDEYGVYDYYLDIRGLSGLDKIDDGVVFDLYEGLLYFGGETTEENPYSIFSVTKKGNIYDAMAYISFFIPVLDGYFALISDPYYYEDYNFTGIAWGQVQGGNSVSLAAGYTDYLLVDPEKDDNGIAPAAHSTVSPAAASRIGNAKLAVPAARKGVGRIQSAGRTHFRAVESLREVKAASFETVEVARKSRKDAMKPGGRIVAL